MQPLGRVDTTALFRPERDALIELLESLNADQWHAPTVCEGWTVKDIAAHIVADDLGSVSREADGYRVSFFAGDDWGELLAYINRQNEAWVDAMRRLSPRRTGSERAASTWRETAWRSLSSAENPII